MGLNFDNNDNREKAKDFLQLIMSPSVDESGLLDDIKLWKTNNQINVITKAQEIINDRHANVRKVPLKVLSNLLEQASLEEDEGLQKRWAALIASTAVEGSSINNTLYSHILGQLSKEDAEVLDFIYKVSTEKAKDLTGQDIVSIIVARDVLIKQEELKTKVKSYIRSQCKKCTMTAAKTFALLLIYEPDFHLPIVAIL
jgi:hypothetical protein